MNPLFFPGWPMSWAKQEISRQAYSNSVAYRLKPFSKKNAALLATSTACVELWYGFMR